MAVCNQSRDVTENNKVDYARNTKTNDRDECVST